MKKKLYIIGGIISIMILSLVYINDISKKCNNHIKKSEDGGIECNE